MSGRWVGCGRMHWMRARETGISFWEILRRKFHVGLNEPYGHIWLMVLITAGAYHHLDITLMARTTWPCLLLLMLRRNSNDDCLLWRWFSFESWFDFKKFTGDYPARGQLNSNPETLIRHDFFVRLFGFQHTPAQHTNSQTAFWPFSIYASQSTPTSLTFMCVSGVLSLVWDDYDNHHLLFTYITIAQQQQQQQQWQSTFIRECRFGYWRPGWLGLWLSGWSDNDAKLAAYDCVCVRVLTDMHAIII